MHQTISAVPILQPLRLTPSLMLNLKRHRRSQYEANRGTRLGKILPNTVDFYFFIRLIILEDFIRLISYNGPCVRLGCSFFLATALKKLILKRGIGRSCFVEEGE